MIAPESSSVVAMEVLSLKARGGLTGARGPPIGAGTGDGGER